MLDTNTLSTDALPEEDLPYEAYNSESDETAFEWDETWAEDTAKPIAHRVQPRQSNQLSSPEEVLQHYWGYQSFRPLQREIIGSILEGRDTMAMLPTGGGKSICFQVPGLMLKGITLVITPLISLMKDQVDHLRQRGIKAAAVHSGMGGDKIKQTLDNCLYGDYKFLYISPERLASDKFREQVAYLDVSLLVIDECHCICQWGYDFRPSYLNILELRHYIPGVPVMALTATATPEVIDEIQYILGFGEESRFFQQSFYRDNISYTVRYSNNKEETLGHILSRVPGSAIVYCRSRERCKELARYIERELGESATFFHAGLTHTEREIRQNRWTAGEVRVMVATNAFGMGIDKPDVRLVIHMTMPSSLEEYYQEAGRAGRDGLRSYAVALIAEADPMLLRRRLSDSFPPEEYIKHTYEMLCNYLGIGEGEGLDRSYDIDLSHFTRTYHMRPAQTKPAIDIMALSGWLEYKEGDAASRLMFTCHREELYQEYVGHDTLLRALLRTYTGLFSDYVFINEGDIALLTGYTAEEVYDMLTLLANRGILHYIPKRNIPRIVFRIRREDSRYLSLLSSAYQERQERMAERIGGVLDYIRERKVCRSTQLLAYFAEPNALPCAKCDVCLEKPEQGLRHYMVETCRQHLMTLKASGATKLRLRELQEALPYNHSDTLNALRYLLAEDMLDDCRIVGDLIVWESES